MPSDTLKLFVQENDRVVFETPLAAALEVGRQRADETAHPPPTLLPASPGAPARLLVASNEERNIGRQHLLLEPLPTGVGINTGLARVGNTGSRFKFKYGPLGNTVNLASRVQGLTKYLSCRLLVTRATREQLGDGFIARRVVKTRVVNIKEPVDLYEVEAARGADQLAFFRASEAALEALEAGDFANAARRSGALLPDHSGDGPLLLVLSRASTALVNRGAGFDAVWEPPGK